MAEKERETRIVSYVDHEYRPEKKGDRNSWFNPDPGANFMSINSSPDKIEQNPRLGYPGRRMGCREVPVRKIQPPPNAKY